MRFVLIDAGQVEVLRVLLILGSVQKITGFADKLKSFYPRFTTTTGNGQQTMNDKICVDGDNIEMIDRDPGIKCCLLACVILPTTKEKIHQYIRWCECAT